MSFHIPSIEAAEAVAQTEVAVAKSKGLYTLTWDHKARPQGGARPGVVSAGNRSRSINSRRLILQQVAAGNVTSTGIAKANGKSVNPTTHRMRAMEDEGLLTLERGLAGKPTTAAITPAGLSWLETHGGEA
ncbi:hypothetical protein [Pararhodobacter sp. CCB-MM2]|uniref:hypothetical protein n=1 Tax=Pararhodobacter sp. CCB-MM2 TaxID=1786003 RepID=UPI00082E398B|nr:hypothetical protein [Pararhodobacter sp. CCB-MM2]